MPTVLRLGPYRFFFYAGDYHEPPHIHVEREACTAKFWLDLVRLERSGGFARTEARKIARLVAENKARLPRSWNDFFND